MKIFFAQRKGFETMVYDLMEVKGMNRQEAINEIDKMIKDSNPESELWVTEELSARNLQPKQ